MTRPYTLRPATAADQPAIKALIRQNQLNPLAIHWQRFLLAVDQNNAMIGCGQVKPHADGSRELASLAIVDAWRKQGIATAIIHQLHATHPGTLWLTCTNRLVPFYTQFGYTQITDPKAMPPYFRRISRLFTLFSRLASPANALAVMVRHPNQMK